jgi:hypothetical protein
MPALSWSSDEQPVNVRQLPEPAQPVQLGPGVRRVLARERDAVGSLELHPHRPEERPGQDRERDADLEKRQVRPQEHDHSDEREQPGCEEDPERHEAEPGGAEETERPAVESWAGA